MDVQIFLDELKNRNNALVDKIKKEDNPLIAANMMAQIETLKIIIGSMKIAIESDEQKWSMLADITRAWFDKAVPLIKTGI